MTRTPRPDRATITGHTSTMAVREGVKPQTLRDAARLIRATAGIPGLRWPARALREAIADHLEDVAEHMDEALIRIGRAVSEHIAANLHERARTPHRSDHHITPEQGRANLTADLKRLAEEAHPDYPATDAVNVETREHGNRYLTFPDGTERRATPADLDAIANLKQADNDTPRDYRGDPIAVPGRYIYVPEGTDVGTDVIATEVSPARTIHVVNPTGTAHIDTYVQAGDLHPHSLWLWEGEPIPSDIPRGTVISRRALPARR